MRLARSGEVEPVRIGFGVEGNLGKDGVGRGLRVPAPDARGLGRVEDHPRNVEGAWSGVGRDGVGAEFGVAPIGELAERASRGGAAGTIDDAVVDRELGCGELFFEQWHEVARM